MRPGPPFVAISLFSNTAAPNDTVQGFIEARTPEGLDSVSFRIGGEGDAVDGRFEEEVSFFFRWPLGGRFVAGDSTYAVAIAKDLRAFVSRDSQIVRIVPSP